MAPVPLSVKHGATAHGMTLAGGVACWLIGVAHLFGAPSPALGLAIVLLSGTLAWHMAAIFAPAPQRVVATLARYGAILSLILSVTALVAPTTACFVTAIALILGRMLATQALPTAANDNPQMTRDSARTGLFGDLTHVTFARESNPGNWGVSHVQQQPHA